jgi:hypothetical protein
MELIVVITTQDLFHGGDNARIDFLDKGCGYQDAASVSRRERPQG